MVKPTFDLIWNMPKTEKGIIFVHSSRQAQRTAIDMLLQAAIANAEHAEDSREEGHDTNAVDGEGAARLGFASDDQIVREASAQIIGQSLSQTVLGGVGFLTSQMDEKDEQIILDILGLMDFVKTFLLMKRFRFRNLISAVSPRKVV